MTWTHTPTKWDNSFLEILYGNEWELFKEPRRARTSGGPRTAAGPTRCRWRRAHGKTHPAMLTTDLSMRMDPHLRRDHPPLAGPSGGAGRGVRQRLVQAAAPRSGAGLALPRAAGSPADLAVAGHRPRRQEPSAMPMSPPSRPAIAASGLTRASSWFRPAWKAAASYRRRRLSRGGANGGRIRSAAAAGLGRPTSPIELATGDRQARGDPGFRPASGCVSFADLVVLGRQCGRRGTAAKRAGFDVTVPASPRAAAMPPRSRPTWSRSRTWSPGRWFPQLRRRGHAAAARVPADRPGQISSTCPDRRLTDPDRWPAVCWDLPITRAADLGVFTENPGRPDERTSSSTCWT